MMTISIAFGALCRPLYVQLGVPAALVKDDQADADAIARLAVRGLLSEAEKDRAHRRLAARLIKKYRGLRRPSSQGGGEGDRK